MKAKEERELIELKEEIKYLKMDLKTLQEKFISINKELREAWEEIKGIKKNI